MTPAGSIQILHVDDEPEFGDLAKTVLERRDDPFAVVTETSARDGLDRLKTESIDCVVSDYDMPEMDGLDFLEAVRGLYPEMPFILFTGKGSEEIASEAITRGVTDYLQKGGTEQYEVLANRIRNSVGRYRTEHELERSREFLDRVLDLSPAAVVVLDGEGNIVRTNEPAETVLGLSEAEITDRTFNDSDWQIVGTDGEPIPDGALPFKQVLDTGAPVYGVEHGIRRGDGDIVWLSINAAPLWDETATLEHVVAVLSDEPYSNTQTRHREETIRHLEGLGRVLSHDLGNMLSVARTRLDLARETGEDEQFEAVDEALIRAVDLLTDLTDAIQAGDVVDEVTTVDAGTVFDEAWKTQETERATKDVRTGIHIRADETALLRVFENLIRNAFEHGSETATVRIGTLADGFYVEDDGPGIPEHKRKQVFEPGYTIKEEGTGIGLQSIQQIALAHGWEIRIADGSDGGARFEFTNVKRP